MCSGGCKVLELVLIGTPILVALGAFALALVGGLMAPLRNGQISREQDGDV